MPQEWKARIKDTEVKYVASGLRPFREVEDPGLIEMVQLGIDLGSEFGQIDAKECLVGRKTVAEELKTTSEKYRQEMAKTLQKPIATREISGSMDLWRDMFRRYYLDFSVSWLEGWNLRSTQMRCGLFDQAKTAENIQAASDKLFDEFGLIKGDMPITTDRGANVIAGLRDELRFQCFGHRLNNVNESSWDALKASDETFRQFDESLHSISAFAHQCDLEIPVTIKQFSATRPWRSFFLVPNSILRSYDRLREELSKRNELYRMQNLDFDLLQQISKLFETISLLFDVLERSSIPTLQNVVPTFYKVLRICQPSATDLPVVAKLKKLLAKNMHDKYYADLQQAHFLAMELDPSFKSLDNIAEEPTEENPNMKTRKEVKKDTKLLLMDMAKVKFLKLFVNFSYIGLFLYRLLWFMRNN